MQIAVLPTKTPEEFRKTMESKGWTLEMLGLRWDVTPRRVRQIMMDTTRPRYYDDAVENLPLVIGK